MKKLLSLLFVLSLIIGVTLALGITSSAEEEAFFPEINEITETPLNIEAYGITYDSIVSRYPDKLNVTHRDGKLYVEDFGMPNLCFDDYHASKIYNFELIDGQWVADYTESDYSSTGRFEIRDGDWTLSYYNEEFNYLSYDKSDSDTGFELYVSINGLYISYDLVIKGVDCYVNNFYSTTNDLEKNEVYLNEKFLYVTYEADGTLSSISAYQSNWYYLNEGDVWSENYSGSSVCEAPAGFEEYTYEGVLDMLPCVIDCGNHSYTEFSCTQDEYCINCYKLERKAPGHIFSESNCITPKICYNCGETQDDPTGHSWIYDGKMMSCAICDAVDALPTIPTPENVTYVSKNLSAHGIYHSEIWDVFVKSLDTTYENGVLSIKNCGFESLRFYSLYDDRHYDPTLVDNFWQIEMSEDVYNYQLYVYVTYDGWEGLFSDFETLEYIYYSDYYPSYWSAHVYKDAFILSLEMNIGERNIAVENRYNKDGDLTLSISYSYIDGNSIYVEYNSDRSLSLISLIYNGSWHYYCDEYGWSESPVFRTSCAEPDGFYGYTEATFTAFLPCLIECEGEHSYTTLTCTQDKYCTVCYTIEQTAPGHSFADADCTNSKTCTVCDETEGDALGHSFNNATCLLPMTCTVCGETEGDPLGHSWTDATCEAPKTCALCGETDGNALGHSWVDASCYQPLYCDVCGMSEGDPLEHYWRYSETERLCLNCSTVEEFLPLPTFDYPDRVANNLSDYGIDFSDLLSNFELDIISYYEDGIIYVKDEGFDTVSVYAFNSFNSYPLTLTDGIWHMEMDEDTLNAGMLIETTRDGWEISYRGNHLDIATFSDDEYLYYKFSVYDDMLIIEFDLNFNDILYRICGYYYSNGTLEKLKVTGYEIATSAFVYYNADRTPIYAGLMPEYNWYYYTEELGWLTSIAYETPAEAPAGFENYTIETFTALLPCFLECEGEHSYTTLTCTQDKYCTVCYKFVEKTAGHDWLAGNCFLL